MESWKVSLPQSHALFFCFVLTLQSCLDLIPHPGIVVSSFVWIFIPLYLSSYWKQQRECKQPREASVESVGQRELCIALHTKMVFPPSCCGNAHSETTQCVWTNTPVHADCTVMTLNYSSHQVVLLWEGAKCVPTELTHAFWLRIH